MVFKDACDCCGLERPYLVFEGMADLSGCSINIRHKEIFLPINVLKIILGLLCSKTFHQKNKKSYIFLLTLLDRLSIMVSMNMLATHERV
jgi:hypothetical protein